jgi:hypothetical protein
VRPDALNLIHFDVRTKTTRLPWTLSVNQTEALAGVAPEGNG